MNNQHHGFTLVELLVVLAIIGILAGILMPVLQTMQNSSKSTKCAANLRQLQLGNILYSNDWNGSFVPGAYYDPSTKKFPNPYTVNPQFAAYAIESGTTKSGGDTYNLGMVKGLFCPLSKPPTLRFQDITYSYAANMFIMPSDSWPSVRPLVARRTYPLIQEKVAFMDGLWANLNYHAAYEYADGSNAYYGHTGYLFSGSPAPEGVPSKTLAYRHRTKANVVFYDGRVQIMSAKELYVPTNFKELWFNMSEYNL